MRLALVEVPFTFSGLFFPIDSAHGVPLRGHGTVSALQGRTTDSWCAVCLGFAAISAKL